MDATIIIAIVPVVLLVAYIVWLVRAKVTEGRDIDLREPITGVVICLVAVLIIGSMTASTVTYTYSEDTNTLYINQNLIDRNQPFDSYGDEVKSVVIGNNCRLIETGTLDSLTKLEYVSIQDDVEVRQDAFSVSFYDPFGSAIADLSPGEFVGAGDGALYSCDESIFVYNGSNGITGLTSDASDASVLVLPRTHGGRDVTAVATSAFSSNATITKVLALPSCPIQAFNSNAFNGCTSLTVMVFPDHLQSIYGNVFQGATALEKIGLPSTLKSIGNAAFNGCSAISELAFPASITSIASYAFNNCTGVTEVIFESGFDPSALDSQAFRSWSFFASDGTTALEKTAANLAGKTFQGTAAALVEVAPGQLSLTPEQIQMVQLHTQELQQQELDIQPLPFQPAVQTQDQEPVSA